MSVFLIKNYQSGNREHRTITLGVYKSIMYQLEILTKMPEPKPDGIIRIRPGESTIVQIDMCDSAPDIRGRPAEWRFKTIPAVIIAITDDLLEIFRVFQAPEEPEDAVPVLSFSSDRIALLSCRADGKILYRKTADCSSRSSEPMQYLHEIIAKTEYCIVLCSQRTPDWMFLAGQIAQFARDQNTLIVLALIGKGEADSYQSAFDPFEKFHTIIANPDHPASVSPVSLERIHDFCEATLYDIVVSGGRHGLEPDYRTNVRDLMFNGGICVPWHTPGKPDARELLKEYLPSVQINDQTTIAGTYSILKIPWESTIDDAIQLRNSLYKILDENIPSRYPHLVRIEGYSPEIEGQVDLSIWTFTGNREVPSIQQTV
jgi:hypothetical protein